MQEYSKIAYFLWKKRNRKASDSWLIDETHIKLKGKWHYLYHAIDSSGLTLYIWLRKKGDSQAAYAFFKRLIKQFGESRVLATDKAPSLSCTFKMLKSDGYFASITHQTRKYLNNIIEQDHRPIKKRHKLYQSLRTASTTIKGKADNGTSSVFGATILTLLTDDFSLDDLASMPLEEFSLLLQTLGRGNFKDPEKLANSIKKAIELLVEAIPKYQCLTSIPGIGKVYTAGLLAEIGQIKRFDDQTKLAKYARLSWKVKQSGNYQSEHTPLTKQGNRYFRYYQVEAANSVRRHLPDYAEFYKKKYQETPKHQHKRAIVLTARKVVHLVDTLLSNLQLSTSPRSVIDK